LPELDVSPYSIHQLAFLLFVVLAIEVALAKLSPEYRRRLEAAASHQTSAPRLKRSHEARGHHWRRCQSLYVLSSIKPYLGMSLIRHGAIVDATAANALASYTTGANDDIRLHWGFPNSTIKARTGNIYFKIDAPSTYAWVGIGVGKSMLDAMMFVVYKGTNDSVTVSMRTGEHHTPPVYTPTTKVQVLNGSGVADGRMVAEVKYADFNMEGKDVWMCAWDSVGPLELSDKKDAVIHKHDGNRQFTINHSAAAISSETNVFSASDDGSDNGIAPYVAPVNYDTIVLAHGIIMSALFLVLYPAGAIIMPLFGNWFYHAVEQCIAYLIMWVGFGLGVTYASYAGMVSFPNS
jgi:hypothetical protein